jgi:D-lactate dehydrogenase (cytochrome)
VKKVSFQDLTPDEVNMDAIHPSVTEELVAALQEFLGDRVTATDVVREHHSRGESYHTPAPPDLVTYPQSTEEISAIVRACADRNVPIVAFGAGTSLEGQVLALKGGVCIDLTRMNKVLRVSVEDLDATVQAGVTHRQLNKHLANTGLTFFIDPGADATIGGMTATGASGTTAVRYGTMRENVRGLTVVLADGRIIRTGGRARKSSAGYDLTRLFVASEGTLGVISEVTVRLQPLPEAVAAAVCTFPGIDAAVRTVISTIQLAVPVARIELLDDIQMDAVNKYSRLDYPPLPTLFFEFHGRTDADVNEQAQTVEAIAAEHSGSGFRWVTQLEDRTRLWKARHDAYYAALALRPGSKAWTTDVCVPISRLADCIVESKRDLEASPLTGTLVGHVGDGNFHIVYLIDPDRPEELNEARRLTSRMVTRALEMGGTCTGEHGVGVGKMPFLPDEHGDALDAMRAIKRALDPKGLMNPGKIFAL